MRIDSKFAVKNTTFHQLAIDESKDVFSFSKTGLFDDVASVGDEVLVGAFVHEGFDGEEDWRFVLTMTVDDCEDGGLSSRKTGTYTDSTFGNPQHSP